MHINFGKKVDVKQIHESTSNFKKKKESHFQQYERKEFIETGSRLNPDQINVSRTCRYTRGYVLVWVDTLEGTHLS